MTDKTELEVTAADDGKEYVIRKGGYFYRPKAEGYTSNANDAGRFSLKQAILHSFPNGPDGPRDGITYELATRTPDPTPVAWQVTFVSTSGREWGRKIVMTDPDPKDWLTVSPLYAHPPAVPADGLVEALCHIKDETQRRQLPLTSLINDIATQALAAHRGEA